MRRLEERSQHTLHLKNQVRGFIADHETSCSELHGTYRSNFLTCPKTRLSKDGLMHCELMAMHRRSIL